MAAVPLPTTTSRSLTEPAILRLASDSSHAERGDRSPGLPPAPLDPIWCSEEGIEGSLSIAVYRVYLETTLPKLAFSRGISFRILRPGGQTHLGVFPYTGEIYLLDDDLALHPRVRRAGVIIGARLREGDGLRLALVQYASVPFPLFANSRRVLDIN